MRPPVASKAVAGIATGRGDLAASLVLIFPLLLAYELGALVVGRVNGADVVTGVLYAIAGGRTVFLLVHVVLAVAFLWWIRRGHRWSTLSLDIVAPVVLEAAVYAFTLGTVVSIIVERLLGLGVTGPSIIAALGAGVHEELVFRLILVSGLVMFARRVVPPRVAIAIAIVVSAVLFAAAHHAAGEPWSAHAFAFRSFAGVAFALIFWFRSLAHAVYAHVLYDLVVAAAS